MYFRYANGRFFSPTHTVNGQPITAHWATNQSRAALREAELRETESLIEAFQTLRGKSWTDAAGDIMRKLKCFWPWMHVKLF